MTMHHFWAQNGPLISNKISFRKSVNEPCFFYSCLPTCQKLQSDINLLLKYWWFKNTEISLAESHFCLYLRTRFFPRINFRRMLMNHKNFGFTKISKLMTCFLKMSKNHVFGPFLTIFTWSGFFPKNPVLSHTTIYRLLPLC